MMRNLSNIAFIVAVLVTAASAETVDLTAVQAVVSSDGWCDSQYYTVGPNQPYVCDGGTGSDQMVRFDGPSVTWGQLPSTLTVRYNAPDGLRVKASGNFRLDLTLVATQVSVANAGTWYASHDSPGTEGNTTCAVTTASGSSLQSSGCEGLSIHTYGTYGNETYSYSNTCKLQLHTTVSAPSSLESSALTLSVDFGSASDTVRQAWETRCAAGELEYSWVERYYITGLTTYNNENTILSFTGDESGGESGGATSDATRALPILGAEWKLTILVLSVLLGLRGW